MPDILRHEYANLRFIMHIICIKIARKKWFLDELFTLSYMSWNNILFFSSYLREQQISSDIIRSSFYYRNKLLCWNAVMPVRLRLFPIRFHKESQLCPFITICIHLSKDISYFLCDTYEIQRKINFWKQPPRGVLSKRCSEDMRQIYNTHAEVWFA